MNEQSRNQAKISAVKINPESQIAPAEKSVTGLIRDLAHDATELFTKEVALAKSEITHSLQEAKTGAVSVISGGSVLFAGFLFLLGAATLGLAQVMQLWLAALIVGGVVALIGFIMVQAGKKKLETSAFTPEHTLNSLRKDRDAARGVIR